MLVVDALAAQQCIVELPTGPFRMGFVGGHVARSSSEVTDRAAGFGESGVREDKFYVQWEK